MSPTYNTRSSSAMTLPIPTIPGTVQIGTTGDEKFKPSLDVSRADDSSIPRSPVVYDHVMSSGDSDTSRVDDSTIAIETNFDRLVEDIRTILGPSSGINSADVDVEDLMKAMKEYDSCTEHEWEKYALNDPTRNYTRNGVDDINHKANLLVLVWNPLKGSLVHDHANAHCIVKILKGTLREELYGAPELSRPSELKLKKVSNYHTNEVSYMSDKLGLHRMTNPSATEVAISLHLYTPPYASKYGCRVFNERDGTSHVVSMSNLYSDKGVRNLGPNFYMAKNYRADSCE